MNNLAEQLIHEDKSDSGKGDMQKDYVNYETGKWK